LETDGAKLKTTRVPWLTSFSDGLSYKMKRSSIKKGEYKNDIYKRIQEYETLGIEKCMSSFLFLSSLPCNARIAALEARISL